jgi:hypothetical protein
MVIKEAKTDEEFQKICQYLKTYNMPTPNSICLYYSTDETGKILGVSGFEYVPIVEPLCANSGNVADKLYEHVMEQMKNKVIQINADRIECYISDNKLEKMTPLLKKKNFKFIEKTNRFTKLV